MSGLTAAAVRKPSPAPTLTPPGSLLQRKCACGTHTVAGGECESCGGKKDGVLQRSAGDTLRAVEPPPVVHEVLNSPGQPLDAATRAFMETRFAQDFTRVRPHSAGWGVMQNGLAVGRPGDSFEREADGAAARVTDAPAPQSSPAVGAGPLPGLRRPQADTARRPDSRHDFSRVRVHTDSRAAESAQAVNALAYTVGNHIVFNSGQYAPAAAEGRRLLAHELAHVVQQGGGGSAPSLQRKVILKGTEMAKKARDAFLKARKWADAWLARSVMNDMAEAADSFDFASEQELESEIVKRVSTSQHMKESQATVDVPGGKQSAFGYPFTGDSLLYGPRVNYAARDYWEPPTPDGYALRTDKKKNEQLRGLPRNRRHEVYGDQPKPYSWKLTAKGKADPYTAIKQLFVPQPAHKRTLIHCDFLVSMVNFLSFADSVGAAEFNKRVKAYGVDKITLRWNAFQDLETEFFVKVVSGGKEVWEKRKGMGSLQRVRPSSEADLVIGDHVVFFNHLAYDPLNKNIGNAWRLENAVLIGKDNKSEDIYLGHGSGRRSAGQLRAKLAEEFNDVAKQALDLVEKTKSKDAKKSAEGKADLARKFPNVKQAGTEWHIQGDGELCTGKKVDEKLRKIKAGEVIGPRDPCDTTKMFTVDRPVESAK